MKGCVEYLFLFFIQIYLVLLCGCGGESQPINFSHKKHIDQGIECNVCHQFYQERQNSGRPVVETCTECHSEPITDSIEEKKLIENFVSKGAPIPWKRIYYEPPHVYFTHFRHVVYADIKCETCHGNVGEQKKALKKPLKEVTMYFCIGCHEKRGVSADCITCHK